MRSPADSVEEIWNKWADDMLRYATVLVGPDRADDVVDDVVVTLLERLTNEPDRRFERGYVLTMVLNTARMLHRSQGRRERREWKVAELPYHAELLADPSVLIAVGRLSVMQRAVIYLTYWEDLTPGAVAEQMGVSVGSVKRHLARGRARLRKVL
ncbi:MAG: sigma-70 family RNA polymerase sigma factor [Actinomycetota bacterium]